MKIFAFAILQEGDIDDYVCFHVVLIEFVALQNDMENNIYK